MQVYNCSLLFIDYIIYTINRCLVYIQINALESVFTSFGVKITHVKCHRYMTTIYLHRWPTMVKEPCKKKHVTLRLTGKNSICFRYLITYIGNRIISMFLRLKRFNMKVIMY